MLKKKAFWITLILFAALSAGGYAFYNYRFATAQQATTETPMQTATVKRGELVISASGVGTVIPAEERSVGFSSSVVIEKINVQIGQEVQAGDVLAKQGNVEKLELAVASAELVLTNAKVTLQDLYDNLDLDRANAQLAIYEAQAALEDATDAREALNYLRCNSDTIEDYYSTYLDAVKQVNELTDQNAPSERISNVEKSRDTALANYNYCTAPRTDTEIGEADATISLAQATLDQAQKKYETLQDGPEPVQVEAAEADVTIAEYNLTIARQGLEGTTLVAPFSGTIMEISAQAGETTAASFITIADLQIPMLEIYLDETDMAMAGVGYEVEVVFDALPEQTFIGHITQVYPGLTSSGSATVVRAIVQLDPESFNKPQTLPVGMSASVEVVGSRAENALLVPVEALRELGENEYAVFVMTNGKPTLTVVTVGIMDYVYAEITSGLEEGDVVTTGIVETE